jgi:uncharacterized protein involved in exopolysaccharide biosynthesis
MQSQQKFGGLEASDLRGHYEDVTAKTLRSIARHIWVIVALVMLALTVAALLLWQLPRQYSVEVLVQPDLFLSEDSAKDAPVATVEGSSFINGETRLIRSPMIARAVVKRLGLDRDPEFAGPRKLDWLRTAVLPLAINSSSLERATWRVGGKLEVVNDPRSYLISVSFTASTPKKAASVADAFALEYFRAKAMQRLADRVTATNRELAQQSARYGDKHPSIVQLRLKLETIRSRLQTVANSPAMSLRDIGGNGSFTRADPDPRPSSPNGFLIFGLAFALPVALAPWLAIWLDSRGGVRRRRLTAPLIHTGGVQR